MARLRFSTRVMFLVIAMVATLLGYAQWRRQAILREAAAIRSQGFTLLWGDAWIDLIWLTVPREAAFEYCQDPDGNVRTALGNAPEEELNLMYTQACDRLRALGVEHVRLDIGGKPGNTYTSTRHGNQSE
jgi:hypothetical protein